MFNRQERAQQIGLPIDLYEILAASLAWDQDTIEYECLASLSRWEIDDIHRVNAIRLSVIRSWLGSFPPSGLRVTERPYWRSVTLAASTFFQDESWPLKRDGQLGRETRPSSPLLWPSCTLEQLAQANLEGWLAAYNAKARTLRINACSMDDIQPLRHAQNALQAGLTLAS